MAQQTMAKQPPKAADIQQEKPKSSKAGLVVFIIIFVIILATVGICYWFNLFGLKSMVYKMMGKELPGEVIELTEDEKRIENERYFAELQAGIDTQNKQMDVRKAQLDAREAELAEREAKYLADKAEFDSLYEAFEKRKLDVKEAAKIYEQMESSAAADILVKYPDKNEVARIISNLTDAKAAEVLTEMDATYASDLLRVIN